MPQRNDGLACPAEVHDAIKKDPSRCRSECRRIGVQKFDKGGEHDLVLFNHVECEGTMALGLSEDPWAVAS